MKGTRFGILLLGILLGISGLVVVTAPGARAAPTRSFVLYGDSLDGWGFTKTTITNPGPTLIVNAGDTVSLELFSNDSVTHTWFIDYNNNTAQDTGEPTSGDIKSPTVPTWFNFTADPAHVGTWTYRCAVHPEAMHGLIEILPAANIVLYGSATAGWGYGPSNITNPGPSLTVTQGQTVSFEFVSQDGAEHSFFVDVQGTGTLSPSDPQSPAFGGSSHPSVLSWSWTVDIAPGNYTYECGVHLAAMKGTIHVLSSTPSTPPSSGPDYTLYAGIIVVIVVIALAAVVVIRRRPKVPPAQPPAQPPEQPPQA